MMSRATPTGSAVLIGPMCGIQAVSIPFSPRIQASDAKSVAIHKNTMRPGK